MISLIPRLKFITVVLIILSTPLHANTMKHEHFWKFDVYLDDEHIGFHNFSLKSIDGQQRITSNAKFNVQVLFINVYSYSHENSEIWHNQCLTYLNAHTDDNGKSQYVKLSYDDQQSIIETSQGKHTVNQCLTSFAYWAPELLTKGQALNSQTGELIDITLSYIGPEQITINNTVIDSEYYRLQGKDLNIGLWYSKSRQWLALKSTLKNGRVIHYQLQEHLIL